MGDIAVQRVMRAGLIREHVGNDVTLHNFGQDIGAIADETHRERFFILARVIDQTERFIQRPRDLVAVTAF